MTAWSSALGTLAHWKVNGRLEALDWAGRKALCRELCDGLHFLHARASVVHRDLKLTNCALYRSAKYLALSSLSARNMYLALLVYLYVRPAAIKIIFNRYPDMYKSRHRYTAPIIMAVSTRAII